MTAIDNSTVLFEQTTVTVPIQHQSRHDFDAAIRAWTNSIGSGSVVVDMESLSRFHSSTVGVARQVPAVLYPKNEQQVQKIVEIANQFQTPIYPVSTGRNWGYGDSSPVTDGCAVVNLSHMNQVVDFSATATYATVTVQPGVTQQILYDYLQENDSPFMVPTHGGGPDCSILGNALERGYGITPLTNHFDAMTSLRAVLGDGSIHESFYEAIGASALGDRRKSQIGPDIDGLFAQSNLGIVTQAKVRLRRRSRHVAAFFFRVNSHKDLAALAPRIEEILFEHHPKALGAINLMNRLRVLSMTAPYPIHDIAKRATLSDQQLSLLGKQHDIPEWLGAGTLYAESRQDIRRVIASIKKHLGKYASQLVWFDSARVKFADTALRLLPGSKAKNIRDRLTSIRSLLDIASGKPSRVALSLANWRSQNPNGDCKITDPAAQGCGIIWYSPYVPIDASFVNEYRQMVETTCREHGIEPLITFTSVDDQTFDSTVPILFDHCDEKSTKAAKSCYSDLTERGRQMGVVPYRYGIQQMKELMNMNATYWRNLTKIGVSIAQNRIIAPNRYSSPSQ